MLPFDRDGTTSVFSPSFSLWETSLRFRLGCLWFRMNAMCTLFPFANKIEKREGWKNWSTTTRHVHSRVGKRIRIYWSDFTRPDRREGTKERDSDERRGEESRKSPEFPILFCAGKCTLHAHDDVRRDDAARRLAKGYQGDREAFMAERSSKKNHYNAAPFRRFCPLLSCLNDEEPQRAINLSALGGVGWTWSCEPATMMRRQVDQRLA